MHRFAKSASLRASRVQIPPSPPIESFYMLTWTLAHTLLAIFGSLSLAAGLCLILYGFEQRGKSFGRRGNHQIYMGVGSSVLAFIISLVFFTQVDGDVLQERLSPIPVKIAPSPIVYETREVGSEVMQKDDATTPFAEYDNFRKNFPKLQEKD